MIEALKDFRLTASFSNSYVILCILAMALTTFLPRYLPMALLKKRTLPHWFEAWLHFVPPAIFGALVFPDIFLKNNELYLSLENIPLLTTLIIAPIVVKTKSLGAAVVCGGVVFGILQYLL
ncbi:MAG: AzlD domain-containing protein [Acidaminococcus sp.]|jgi:branched-subunit amino acid transport protein|nr:AzlD domain-containing protein [Acidaminococcus sp.]MCI2101105.1 AzlD domain-containing protein [Acidaminococcus sp.]MCI2115502.1 AzlD domain-containing protein [Acidaminococcus sp.]MCI2117634.1 AzlD domain-containing protein [Acidaminococcus sp.]